MGRSTTSEHRRFTARKATRALAGLAAFALLSLGAVSDASSLTLREFDRLTAIEKENFITTVLHFSYYTYQNNPATASKARCMADLGRRELSNGEPYLSALVTQRIDMRRAEAAHGRTVEQIVKELVDQECQTF